MLSTLLGSETRARILTLLLSRRERPYHVRELVREAGIGTSGVQRELARLARLGLIQLEAGERGRRIIRVVDAHPLIEPLDALVTAEGRMVTQTGVPDTAGRIDQAELATRVNPHVRPHLAAILEACRRAAVERAVLFGSAAEINAAVRPRDIDLLVRLGGPPDGRGVRYFTLLRELERATALPVDLVEDEGVRNPYLQAEIEHTGVVVLEAA